MDVNYTEKRVLTCAYCGKEYLQDTPAHGNKVLTDHIKVCEKHPLRSAEQKIEKLRAVLLALVGTSDKTELEAMESTTRALIVFGSVPQTDGEKLINVIPALLETEIDLYA